MTGDDTDFEELLAGLVEGESDTEKLERLRDLMRGRPERIARYREQMAAHALLQWRTGEVNPVVMPDFRAAGSGWFRIGLAAAAILMISMTGFWLVRSDRSAGKTAGVWMEVLESESAGKFHLTEGAKLSLNNLTMPPGFLRFRLESGAVVAVTGPADLTFVDPMKMRVNLGKVTAEIDEGAKGFVVETAQTKVVDLGTKFGVDVAAGGHTDVVVFQGEVELHGQKTPVAVSRLTEGEAVRVDGKKKVSRISSIASGPIGDDEWSADGVTADGAVIASVHDNLHNPKSNFYYRILRGGMGEDAQAFIAKRHEWNGIDAAGMPLWLQGADLVRTFSAGDGSEGLELRVEIAVAAELYVFVDSRLPAPDWLMKDFTDTGAIIGLENAPLPNSGVSVQTGPGKGNLAPFAIWKRRVETTGTVRLGPPPEMQRGRPYWMYGIAAKRL